MNSNLSFTLNTPSFGGFGLSNLNTSSYGTTPNTQHQIPPSFVIPDKNTIHNSMIDNIRKEELIQRLKNFKLGICMIYDNGTAVARTTFCSVPIQNSTNMFYQMLRDIDFSLEIMNNSTFVISLFLFDPTKISYQQISNDIRRTMPNDSDFFKLLGHYPIVFDINSTHNFYDGTHFYGKCLNSKRINPIDFDFFFHPLNKPQEYPNNIIPNSNNLKYIISNPHLTIDLSTLVF